MKKGFWVFFIFSLLSCHSKGFSEETKKEGYNPWFTGPLLAPSPENPDPKHPEIEPIITIFSYYALYDNNWKMSHKKTTWSINPLLDFQFGITEKLGAELVVSSVTNIENSQSDTHLEDSIFRIGYQLSEEEGNSWVPSIRLFLEQVFPTGNYQKFSPSKRRIAFTGLGSFQTGPGLVVGKVFSLPKNFLSLRASVQYLFPLSTHIKGFNTYGGGFGTKGKVKTGQSLTAFFSGEYTLGQHWVLAFDTEFFYQRKSPFSGVYGKDLSGNKAEVGLPTLVQFSFAPAVEYNFSSSLGILWGSWFTLIGRNTRAFASGFFAFVYTF